MDGCEKCMPSWQAGRQWADCDLLEVYSSLCYQMPGEFHLLLLDPQLLSVSRMVLLTGSEDKSGGCQAVRRALECQSRALCIRCSKCVG